MVDKDLFPPIEPFESGMLPLDARHAMYWEISGNPDGVPVVFLHGGPGAGAGPVCRRFFDPDHYRIILFDQRGAGRSTPEAEITDNTTAHLIDDMERLRRHLGVERWLLFGGSWGSALALAYGQAHPDRSLGFILRGIFLGQEREIDWFLNYMGIFFPEAWQRFIEFLPAEERQDPLAAYHARLVDPDPDMHMPAARAWSRYEASCSTLRPRSDTVVSLSSDRAALGLARIEAHYFVNRMFLADRDLIAGLPRIRHLPAAIVQGRYDVVCPIVTADAFARAWPEATYKIVEDAGHSALEPGIRKALVAVTERFKIDPAGRANLLDAASGRGGC